MPIETPAGTLEVENAKFRASSVEATIAVGIGTESNDAYPLQVFKETSPDIRLSEGSTISSAARFYSNNSNLYIQTGTNFTSGSSGDIAFQTMVGQSTHMVIKSDGNVGIGTTSPRGMLDIYTGATSTAGLIIDRNASGTYRSELYQESNGLVIKVGDGSNAPAENMRITRSDVMIPGRLALGTSTASSSQFYVSAPGNGTSTSTGDFHITNSGTMAFYGTRPWITTTNGQGHTGKLCSINLYASGHQPAIEWTRDTGQGTNQRNWLLRQETDDALYTWHYNGSVWSIPMYVKSDAVISQVNVGIGTASPRGMLDIYTGATSTAGLIIDRYASGTYRSELYQESNGLAIKVGDGSNAPTENMRITSSDVMIPGRLAVGTGGASSSQFYISAPGNGTSTSTGDFHVNNSAGMTLYGTRPWITTTNGQGHTGKLCSMNFLASGHQPAIEWTRDVGQGTNQRNWLLRQETDDALYTWHYNGSVWSVPMYVKSDAVISQVNVGIGTGSPSYKLNVLTDTNYDGISLRDSTRELLKIAKGNNGAYINMFESSVSKVNISTSGVSYLNGGNVGIGTNSPSYKLDVNGSMRHNGLVMSSGTNVDQIKSISVTLTLTTTWQDTGINHNDLATGSHLVQIYNVSNYTVGGGNYEETYTGIMSWFAGSTNSSEVTEIPMTAAGHAPNNGHIYLRVARTPVADGRHLRLQMRSDNNTSGNYTYYFGFRKLI